MKPPLRHYQETALEALMAHENFYLADDPGLGKSRPVIEALDRLGLLQVLIIVPAAGLVSWVKELRLWSTGRLPVILVRRSSDIAGPGIYVITYDRVVRGLWQPLLRPWDLLVLDEAHYIKSESAARTKLILGHRLDGANAIAGHADRVWCLSGTPFPNNAFEIYPVLRTLFPKILTSPVSGRVMSKQDFLVRFCRTEWTKWGDRVIGSKNMGALKTMMAPIILKRRKEDVLKELPKLQTVSLPLEPDPTHAEDVERFDRDIRQLMRDNPGVPLEDLLHRNEEHLATKRRLLGIAKALPAAEWLEMFLDGGAAKILVFCIHREVIATIAAYLRRKGHETGVIDGSTPTLQRTKQIDAFQNPGGDMRCMVMQSRAAGLAITLTAASDVLIVEPDWTPAVNEQAIARAHRLGQTKPVLARYAYAEGSLDEIIIDTFTTKAAEIAELI
jgi:SWI/SNF-related matrix-associated actin-dependent regulator of chromatin subfamily A-like protein 1